jgi:hypothetical protein
MADATLCESCRVGDAERVKVLLSNKHADPNAADDHGLRPLLYAAFGDHACCLTLLLGDARVDPTLTGRLTRSGLSALIIAVCEKAARATEILLADPRVDPNQGDAVNGTPLLLASSLDFAAGTALLLRHPHIQPDLAFDHKTALKVAAAFNHVDVLRVLLADGRAEIGSSLLLAVASTKAAVRRISAEQGDYKPWHCFVLLLESRRVDPMRLAAILALMQTWLPTQRELRVAASTALSPQQETARLLVPVLKAQASGEFRWCAHCHHITPDVDLNRCGGCQQVGYCDRAPPGQKKPCHVLHWNAGHKQDCARFQAEATEKKPRGGRDKKGRRR